MKDFIGSLLVAVGLAAMTAPLVPLARTIGVNAFFWLLTRMRGKPNYTPGTRYASLTAPSGAKYGPCWIERTDFGFVYIRLAEGGVMPIKKIRFKEYQVELLEPDNDEENRREADR